jgi:hypothetical protein
MTHEWPRCEWQVTLEGWPDWSWGAIVYQGAWGCEINIGLGPLWIWLVVYSRRFLAAVDDD